MKRMDGYTLFELLVTISIIGILTVIAIVSYSSAQAKGRDARRIEDMKTLQTAAEQYYATNNYIYPSTQNQAWAGVLETWPKDPKTGDPYACSSMGAAGYCCCIRMDNVKNGNSPDTSCAYNSPNEKAFYCVSNRQ